MANDKFHVDDEQLRALLHLISHDIRNPVAAIVTNLEFARRVLSGIDSDPDLKDSIEDSLKSCEVLQQILGNFDLLVRGRDVLVTTTAVAITPLVTDVVRRSEGRANQANIVLKLTRDDAASVAMVDKALFSLALENLLSNSIQHAPRGSCVHVAIAESENSVRISITDEGIAIGEQDVELALGVAGHTPAGRKQGTRYGRGLGLLAAQAGASASGVKLTVGAAGDMCELALVAPLAQR